MPSSQTHHPTDSPTQKVLLVSLPCPHLCFKAPGASLSGLPLAGARPLFTHPWPLLTLQPLPAWPASGISLCAQSNG